MTTPFAIRGGQRVASRARTQIAAVVLVVSVTTGCATTTRVTTDARDAHLIVDETDLGPVPIEGIDVAIARGIGDVPVRIVDESGQMITESVIARDTIAGWSWAIAVLSVALTVCAVPSCASIALVTMNPALAFAPCLAVVNCSTAPFATVLAAPSCGTIPVVAGASLVGCTPSLLAFVAFTPAPTVHFADPRTVHDSPPDGTLPMTSPLDEGDAPPFEAKPSPNAPLDDDGSDPEGGENAAEAPLVEQDENVIENAREERSEDTHAPDTTPQRY